MTPAVPPAESVEDRLTLLRDGLGLLADRAIARYAARVWGTQTLHLVTQAGLPIRMEVSEQVILRRRPGETEDQLRARADRERRAAWARVAPAGGRVAAEESARDDGTLAEVRVTARLDANRAVPAGWALDATARAS